MCLCTGQQINSLFTYQLVNSFEVTSVIATQHREKHHKNHILSFPRSTSFECEHFLLLSANIFPRTYTLFCSKKKKKEKFPNLSVLYVSAPHLLKTYSVCLVPAASLHLTLTTPYHSVIQYISLSADRFKGLRINTICGNQ